MSLKEAVKKFVFDGSHICPGRCSILREKHDFDRSSMQGA
jgi:hypothetical protein